MLDIAQEQVIERAKRPLFSGHLESPNLSGDGANQSCGDEVHFELQVVDNVITDMRHTVRACTVCAASADLLAERFIGESVDRVDQISSEEIQEILGIPLSPIRLKCALLPMETLRTVLSKTSSGSKHPLASQPLD
jgi:nitrogen fixation NifU-like protein